jgi:hypothetical protein
MPIAIPKDDIKNVMGITTERAAIASEPIHRPTKIVSIRMFTLMNNIPTDDGMLCLMSRLFMSFFARSVDDTAIYATGVSA